MLAEDQDEITYLDEVCLYAIDHAPDVEVYSSLGYSYDMVFPFTLHTVRDPQPPVSAQDGDGRDITDVIATVDNVSTTGRQFAFDTIELDFGDLSGAEQIKLIYNGWVKWPTEGENSIRYAYLASHPEEQYSYPNYAEVINEHGEWEHIEFPKVQAKARTKALDITDWFTGDIYKLRLHTWFETWFDYIAVDTSPDEAVTLREAPLSAANMYWKGPALQRDRPGAPSIPEFYTTAPLSGFHVWQGNFTRYGDVLPLLTDTDDMYVVMHAGDAITLEFDALPPSSMERDYLVFTDAFYQEMFVRYLFGRQIGDVEPLPFHGMPYYPYPDTMSYPYDAEHIAYLEEYNTREFNPAIGGGHNTIYTDYVKVVVASERRVTNLDTAETFATIQAAIDDTDTLDGHTLFVNASAEEYQENVRVTKSLTILGQDADATSINGMDGGIGVTILANGTVLRNLTIHNGEAGIYVHNDTVALHHVVLDNISVYDCDNGIHLMDVNHSTIQHSSICNSHYTVHPNDAAALYLQNAHFNDVRHVDIGDVVSEFSTYGLQLIASSNNTIHLDAIGDISGVHAGGGGWAYGVKLDGCGGSDDNDITIGSIGNIYGTQSAYAIDARYSDNNQIAVLSRIGTITSYGWTSSYGLYMSYSDFNTINLDAFGDVTGDHVYGIKLMQSHYNQISTSDFGNISASYNIAAGIALDDADYNTIYTGMFGHITGYYDTYGIWVSESSENIVDSSFGNITCTGSGTYDAYGVSLFNSYDNVVTNFSCGVVNGSHDAAGIHIYNSAGNAIATNGSIGDILARDNNAYGIYIDYANGNTVHADILGNITGDGYAYGIFLNYSHQSNISTSSFGTISGTASTGILFKYGNSNNVTTGEIYDINGGPGSTRGIHLDHSNDNNVTTLNFGHVSAINAEGISVVSSNRTCIHTGDFGYVSGISGYGINVHGASNNNTIVTGSFGNISGMGAYAVRLSHAYDNNISTGQFSNIDGLAAYGVSLVDADWNSVTTGSFNEINGTDTACGIRVDNSFNNSIATQSFTAIISDGATTSYGINITGSNDNDISTDSFGNIIAMSGGAYGVYLAQADFNNVTILDVTLIQGATDEDTCGIYLAEAECNNISARDIGTVNGDWAYGIKLKGASHNNVSTDTFGYISGGNVAAGIYFECSADHNNISVGLFGDFYASTLYGINLGGSYNTIITGSFGDLDGYPAWGIYLSSADGNNISTGNFGNITVWTGDATGVYLSHADHNDVVTGNFGAIDTTGSLAYGVHMYTAAGNNVTAGCFGDMYGTGGAFGINVTSSDNNTVNTNSFGNLSCGGAANVYCISVVAASWDNNIATQHFGNVTAVVPYGIYLLSAYRNNVTTQSFGHLDGQGAFGIRIFNADGNHIQTADFGNLTAYHGQVYGISVETSGHNNLTTGAFGVLNASTSDAYGITLSEADDNTVTAPSFDDITGHANAYGISLSNSDHNTIDPIFDTITSTNLKAYGIFIGNSNWNTFMDVSLHDINGSLTAFGIYHAGSHNNTFLNPAIWDMVAGSGVFGVWMETSENTSFDGLSIWQLARSSAYGMYLSGSDYLSFNNTHIWNISDSSTYGMYITSCDHLQLDNTSVWDVSGSSTYGILLNTCNYSRLNNTWIWAIYGSGTGQGMQLHPGYHNTIQNTHIWDISGGWVDGLYISKSGYNSFTKADISDVSGSAEAVGISLSSMPMGSYDNTLTDCTITNISAPTWWSFYSCEWSHGNVITNLTVASYPTAVSFIYGNGIAVKGVESPYAWPAAWTDIGKFVDVSNVTESSWINLSIHYTDGDVWGTDESMLGLYHYNETSMSWELVPSMLYPDDNYMQSNITSFSQYGIFTDTVDVSMYLRTPWNLITVPVQHSWTSRTLGENISGCKVVTRWDVDQQMYIDYIMGIDSPGNPAFAILDGVGYFVGVTHDSWFHMSGPFIESISVTLQPGFNLVGWANVENTTAESLGDNITRCQFVTKWDEIRPQEFYTHVVGSVLNDFTVSTGRGMFVYLTGTGNVTWNGGR
ncbi:MAG: hypothetical protein ACP5FL_01125 [Thermoplasmatota archaeon]